MAKGSRGSIEPLQSGSFRVTVRAGTDPITGRKLRLRETHVSRGDAEAALERMSAQVQSENIPEEAATLGFLLDKWLASTEVDVTTAETNGGHVRRTLKPALGHMPLRKLQHRVDLIDRLYVHLRRCSKLCDGTPFVEHRIEAEHDCETARCRPHVCTPLSAGTVRRIHAILSPALDRAVAWGWMDRNPARLAVPPKHTRRRAKPPSPHQVATLMNQAFADDPELAIYLWLAIVLGARRGEVVALQWRDIELETGQVQVFHNYVVRKGVKQRKGVKTEDGERWVYVDAFTVELLRTLKETISSRLAAVGIDLEDDAYVFSPDPAGRRPWHPDHFTHSYRALADQVGIDSPLKNLRHFNATQLLDSGIDLRTVAGRLGHSGGGATTLKFYVDYNRSNDQRAADLLARELRDLQMKAAAHAPDDHIATSAPVDGRSAPMIPNRTELPIDQLLPPALNLDGGASPYEQLATTLRDAMADGYLASGQPLPPVSAVAGRYGLSRSTVHRAVTMLAKEGRVTVRRGARTIVARPD